MPGWRARDGGNEFECTFTPSIFAMMNALQYLFLHLLCLPQSGDEFFFLPLETAHAGLGLAAPVRLRSHLLHVQVLHVLLLLLALPLALQLLRLPPTRDDITVEFGRNWSGDG